MTCNSADAVWPARSGGLETRYACGGGGTYAPETGIQWYREWDGSTTMRGGPNNTVLTLPYPGSYTPDAMLIGNILAGKAPYIQQTIQYSPAHLGNVWTIANEPNWGPLFTPANYAREFQDGLSYVASPSPLCDFDHDGDVHREDFGHLQACLTGPTVMITDPACRNTDLDGDADADMDNSGRLYRCFSGPGNIADPGCEN